MTNRISNKQKCNHIIGYIESSGYDGDTITEFVYLDSLDLSTANELKSTKGYPFNFCHNCGKKLEGFLDKKIEMLTEEKIKRNEAERIKKRTSECFISARNCRIGH